MRYFIWLLRLAFSRTLSSTWTRPAIHIAPIKRPDGKGSSSKKPFGRDLQSAQELNKLVASIFQESEVFRIDHYLGKDTVQNIMILRFTNAIFEPIWNRRYIEQVQITVTESIGMEGRGDYYEETGALRDMVQNHCIQMMSLTAWSHLSHLAPTISAMNKRKSCALSGVFLLPM